MAKTDKQSLDEWREYIKNIIDSTPTDPNETPEAQKARIARLEKDTEAWFKYYFPRYTFARPAYFHKEATKRIIENPEWFEVRMWSRELAKSTRTMMEALYLVLVGHPQKANGRSLSPNLPLTTYHLPAGQAGLPLKKKYILLISNSNDNAERLLMPYKINLQYNRRIIKDYGKQERPGSWQMGEFVTEGGAAFRALGAGQSPRGSRNEEARPDLIIFDDVDTDVDCRNSEIVNQKWKWIEEAAITTRSISKATTIVFCGNRIATDCCVERACGFADHVDEINIRNEKNRSSWPQKNSEADIDRVLLQKSYAAAQKEYFNNPVMEGSVFKKMAYKPARPLNEYSKLVCYTDPSYKDSKASDFKATVLVGKWQDEFHVIKCYLEQTTTARLIEWHYAIMSIVGQFMCAYYLEQVFLQDIILKEMRDVSHKRGRHIPIMGDTRHKPDKFTRIESLLEPLNRDGKLYLNEYEKNNPYMLRLEQQFLALAPGSSAHDDGPDAVEGAIWIMKNDEVVNAPGSIYIVSAQLDRKRIT